MKRELSKHMKKLSLILAFFLSALVGLAQGRVDFSNDSLHLVYWNPNSLFSPPGLAGQIFNPTNTPSGVSFVADLYMGTTSASLSLYSTTVFNSLTPGRWSPVNVVATSPFIPLGSTVFAVVQVRDQAYAPPSTLTPGTIPAFGIGTYFGYSEEFSFTLGTSGITFTPLSGNWPPGNYPLPPYGYGAIMLTTIPEPATLAFAFASATVAIVCRRRLLNRHLR